MEIDEYGVRAINVRVTRNTLTVELEDGRTISAPVAWFPRLARGTSAERTNWKLRGADYGIHWPDLDEDISIAGLLMGKPSGESQKSLRRWLDSRVRERNSKRRNVGRRKKRRTP